MDVVVTDRIEKQIQLRTPELRVWEVVSSASQFGEWFMIKLDGEFVEGSMISGTLTYPGYEHLTVEMYVVTKQAESLFSYRWRPYAIEPNVDYSAEPMTLVEFRLDDVDGGVLLTITESGFDQIPGERRAKAFRMDDAGWSEQIRSIEAYVSKP